MLPCGLQQTLFAKFLSVTIQGFGNTIGVEQDGVAWSQFAFFHGAIPFVEQAHHRAGCAEPFHRVVTAQKQGRRMATVRVAQLACAIIVFGEEESSVIPTGRVFVKQLIHRAKKSLGLFPSRRALAAQSGLEIGHEQSGSNAFAGYIGYYQPQPAAAEIKKIVIVPTDCPSGMANASVSQRSSRRLVLRKQTGLHLLGDGHFAGSLTLRLQLGGLGAPLCFQCARRLIDLNEGETVSIHIFKNGVPRLPTSPGRLHGWHGETDSASRPFFEQATHVFGKKANSGGLADALLLCGSFGWNTEGDARKARACGSREPASSRRSDNDPPAPLRDWRVHHRLESELLHKELSTALLIPNPERNEL